ncbi:MAG: aldehyde dehydrogenase family protein [Caldimonas sp.]
MNAPTAPFAIPFATDRLLIGGEWRAAASGQTLSLEDPSDGSTLAHIARGSAADIDAAVAAARGAIEGTGASGGSGARPWGAYSAVERGRVLSAIGVRVLENIELLAGLEVHDVGKPLKQSRADAVALARYCEFYGGAADKVHGETLPFAAGYTALTLREPHGVTGHIVPWNYPMQIVGRSVGAALAMGNACVLKPAEEACLTVLAFARICAEAGLPPGALNVVTGLGEEAGAALSAHAGVSHLSFTGSVATGTLVQIAAARNAVPVTLELGGKSPQIVFADADLDAALPFLVNAGIQNAGQTCSAASRILVERPVFEAVKARMAERYRALRVGPAASDLDVGPVISARQKDGIERHLALGRDSGLAVAAEGSVVADAPRRGHYVRPTLFADVPPDHALAQDEIFGPVQVLIAFDGEAEALAIANGTKYGLVAGVWTRDGGRQMRMARALKCGQVFVNNYGAGGGIELPFGGVKHSGHGREKGFEALYGFSSLKTIAIHHG